MLLTFPNLAFNGKKVPCADRWSCLAQARASALPLDVVVGFRCVAGYCRVLFGLRLIATKTAHRDMFRAHLGKSKLCIRGHRCLREPAESCFVKPPYMRAKSVEIG